MPLSAPLQALALLMLLISVLMPMGLHQVDEGFVGVYWRGGALLTGIAEPGFHLKLPLITRFAQVQVTLQTDSVSAIPCGTSGGVLINFETIEVVNRLKKEHVHGTVLNYTVNYDRAWIFDKIHHEINQFCSGHTLQEVYISQFDTLDDHLALALQQDCNLWAPGIEIIAVRVTKPRIPNQIKQNFEEMEAEKTKLLIATEKQKTVEKEAETERKRATIEAEKVAEVSAIDMAREIATKESERDMSELEDTMHLARERAVADAQHYRLIQEAEANKLLLTDEYLQFMHLTSLGNASKIYFGEKIPNMMVNKNP